jgi:hypothetical protein
MMMVHSNWLALISKTRGREAGLIADITSAALGKEAMMVTCKKFETNTLRSDESGVYTRY